MAAHHFLLSRSESYAGLLLSRTLAGGPVGRGRERGYVILRVGAVAGGARQYHRAVLELYAVHAVRVAVVVDEGLAATREYAVVRENERVPAYAACFVAVDEPHHNVAIVQNCQVRVV